MSIHPTSSPAFFEDKYQRTPDPWGFAVKDEELQRYAITIAALSGRRYARAFEPGCSIGVLTQQLASLCDSVEAIDFSSTAVAQARARCAHLRHVHIECGTLATRTSVTEFDLIVLSEIGYYFDEASWLVLSTRLVRSMAPRSTLLAVHWLGHSADHCLSGDTVHHVLSQLPGLRLEHSERYSTFRLDRWVAIHPNPSTAPDRASA